MLLLATIAMVAISFTSTSRAYAESNDDEIEEITELEIEAERYESVEGKWEVEAEVNDKDIKFYVYNIDNETELISEIKKYLNNKYDSDLTTDEITDALEIDDEDEKDEDENEDKEEKVKEKKEDSAPQITSQDRIILIEKLQKQLLALMQLLIEALQAAK